MANYGKYDARQFGDLARTPFGEEVWVFVNNPKNIHAMEVAADLGQPAVAGLEEALLRQFGDKVLDDRAKQMIGHMVRQVMERQGFIIDQNDVKMNSIPFSKGTRYRRPEWHPIHVFRNTADTRDLCFTDTRTGDRLPPLPGSDRWRYSTTFSTELRGTIAFGIRPSDVRKEIKANGFARGRRLRALRPA